MNRCEYKVLARGLGSQKQAYEEVLLAMPASGARLLWIHVQAGLTSTTIHCIFEGSSEQCALLRQKLEDA
jgi:hypothetical protein